MSDYWIGRSGRSSEDHAVEPGLIGATKTALCGETVSVVMGSFEPSSRECDECSEAVRAG